VFGKGFEFHQIAQQARVQKIKQGPEVGQTVFHRRAGQDDAVGCLELFDGTRLLCRWVKELELAFTAEATTQGIVKLSALLPSL
jgi:hypothetical protein